MSETSPAAQPLTITDSDGAPTTLDAAYFAAVADARRARLAAPPLTDEDLAALRERYPEQAWFWTREWYDGERAVDASLARSEQGTIYASDAEFQAALDRIPLPDAHV